MFAESSYFTGDSYFQQKSNNVNLIISRSLDHLFNQEYELYLVNDILLEYEEKLKEKFNPQAAELFIAALPMLSNVHKIDTYFKFRLISEDEDDNKFVDCAIAANAKYLVSEDRHLRILKEIPFPKVEVMRINDFKALLESM
ncbi:MAG: putative toxin-antitoxin system toxin component, PIN family [Bacteroidota bacterium]